MYSTCGQVYVRVRVCCGSVIIRLCCSSLDPRREHVKVRARFLSPMCICCCLLQERLVAEIAAELSAESARAAAAAVTRVGDTPTHASRPGHASSNGVAEGGASYAPTPYAHTPAPDTGRNKRRRSQVDYAALDAQLKAETAARSSKAPRFETDADVTGSASKP